MSMKTMVTVEKRKRPVRRKPAKTPPVSVSLPVGEGSFAEIRAILAEPGERREETPVGGGDCIEHEADALEHATTVVGHGSPSRGAELESSICREMESRFGEDFSLVRVHTGPESAAAARGLRARAYTVGQDVVFGAGQYAPATSQGRRLIAHELAHVVQHRQDPQSAASLRRKPVGTEGAAAVPGSTVEPSAREAAAEEVRGKEPGVEEFRAFLGGIYISVDTVLQLGEGRAVGKNLVSAVLLFDIPDGAELATIANPEGAPLEFSTVLLNKLQANPYRQLTVQAKLLHAGEHLILGQEPAQSWPFNTKMCDAIKIAIAEPDFRMLGLYEMQVRITESSSNLASPLVRFRVRLGERGEAQYEDIAFLRAVAAALFDLQSEEGDKRAALWSSLYWLTTAALMATHQRSKSMQATAQALHPLADGWREGLNISVSDESEGSVAKVRDALTALNNSQLERIKSKLFPREPEKPPKSAEAEARKERPIPGCCGDALKEIRRLGENARCLGKMLRLLTILNTMFEVLANIENPIIGTLHVLFSIAHAPEFAEALIAVPLIVRHDIRTLIEAELVTHSKPGDPYGYMGEFWRLVLIRTEKEWGKK